jgi:hypothetical protein
MDSWTKHGCAIAVIGSGLWAREALSGNLKKQRADLYGPASCAPDVHAPFVMMVHYWFADSICGEGFLRWAHDAGCFCFSPQRFR